MDGASVTCRGVGRARVEGMQRGRGVGQLLPAWFEVQQVGLEVEMVVNRVSEAKKGQKSSLFARPR